MSVDEVLLAIEPHGTKHVLITGGEPLLQRQTPELVERLKQKGYSVSIETHGEISIKPVAGRARIIMDIKTPSSKMSRGEYVKNLQLLKPTDEIKFVIGTEDDYQWAKAVMKATPLPTQEILFSPVMPGVSPRWLAGRILKDQLPVRFQIQLHKLLGVQ
jgi:7-carboxy-7-deazaguanine synthase